MIELEELAIQNFLSFGERQTLSLARQGLVFVEGENLMARKAKSNGSGKSGLIEAPVWCLTGKTLRDVAPDMVVNRTFKKDCVVELRGNKDGVSFSVVRGRRVQGKNVLDFTFGGKNLTSQGDTKETQRQIGLYLGIDYDVLTNTVVFNGQDEKWRFTSIGDAAQKQLLDKILGIEVLNTALKSVKSTALACHAEVSTIEAKLRVSLESLSTLRRTLKGQKQERLRELRAELQKAKRELVSGPSDVELASAKKRLQVAREALDRALERVAVTRASRDAASTRVHECGEEEARWMERYKTAKSLRAGERCDECGSEISEGLLAAHARGLLLKSKDAAERAAEGVEKVVALTSRMDITSKYIAVCKTDIAKVEREYEELKSEATRCDARRAAIVEVRRRIKKLKSSPTFSSLRSDIRDLKLKAKALRLQKDKAEKELSHYNFWVEGFGNTGVKSLYLDYVVPVLNRRAQRYASILSDGMVVEFDSESQTKKGEARDKFRVVVTNEQGANTYEGNSGGEKRKVDIVVARALQSLQEDRVGSNLNVAWYDEVFESLDSTSSEAVLSLLMEDSKRYSSLFVVSHQDWLRSYFPRTLAVVKEDGFSFLEWR